MDYDIVLEQLEDFRELLDRHKRSRYESTEEARSLANDVYSKYGELEEVFNDLLGVSNISVPDVRGGPASIYKNYIEAGYLSGRTTYSHQGYVELLKVIGMVRNLARQPNQESKSITTVSQTDVVDILSRFRQCCQYLATPPENERSVQDIAWIMLRSYFDQLKREDPLPKFGIKSYRPDFSIPEVGLYIEIKFIGNKTIPQKIQEELLADIPAYLAGDPAYSAILVVVYDAVHKLRDTEQFIAHLRSVDGILDVIVIPGIG